MKQEAASFYIKFPLLNKKAIKSPPAEIRGELLELPDHITNGDPGILSLSLITTFLVAEFSYT